VPVQDFFEIASHKVTLTRHNCERTCSPNVYRFKAFL